MRRTWGIDWFAARGLDLIEQYELLGRFATLQALFA